MSLSNKAEIERVIHSHGKQVSGEFYAWYEKQCQRLLQIAIQAAGIKKLVGIRETVTLMRACGLRL